MKLKLKPSQRIKKRYLLIEAISREDIKEAILEYLGSLGWAKATPFFVKSEGKKHIVAVNREEIEKVIASFEVYKNPIKVIRVSGTLKGLRK